MLLLLGRYFWLEDRQREMKLLQIWFDHWSFLTTWYAAAQNCWSINEVRNHLDWSTYYFVDNFLILKNISMLWTEIDSYSFQDFIFYPIWTVWLIDRSSNENDRAFFNFPAEKLWQKQEHRMSIRGSNVSSFQQTFSFISWKDTLLFSLSWWKKWLQAKCLLLI